MATVIDRLKVQGEPAPRNSANLLSPLAATTRANKPNSGVVALDKTYQFILKQAGGTSAEMMLQGVPPLSAPARKMEHLSRVRAANYGISTMDSPFMVTDDSDSMTVEKPNFVLCGLPVGAKEVDPHLYLSDARVGSYKTSAREVYRARWGARSSKAQSEPLSSHREDNRNGFAMQSEEIDGTKSALSLGYPTMPPSTPAQTPISFVVHERKSDQYSAKSALELQGHKVRQKGYLKLDYSASDVIALKESKKVNRLLRREHTADGIEILPNKTPVHNNVHIQPGQVLDENIEILTSKGTGRPKPIRPFVKKGMKTNYNNPYRNVKHKERFTLAGNGRYDFNTVESYMNFNKRASQIDKNSKLPRSILRVPNPCSDTFLLQMMYELNRPKSRKSIKSVGGSSIGAKYSDIAVHKDLEEYVQSKSASSFSKTQSNIDRFQGRKSGKSAKSLKSNYDADTIDEDSVWGGVKITEKELAEEVDLDVNSGHS